MPSLPSNLYTAEQVRALDREAIENQGIPGYVLMTNAARAVFEQITTRWPDIKRLVVFCGAGNNAGDGYVIARLAHEQGIHVRVLYLAAPDRLSGDAWQAHAGCAAEGVEIEAYQSQPLDEYDLLVDALLGTGLQRDLSDHWLDAVNAINSSRQPVISVDIPSGVHADTGRVMGGAVKADCTVTLIGLKRGLFTGDAPDYVGELVFDDLQVTSTDGQFQDEPCQLINDSVRDNLPMRERIAHKGRHGHLLVIGGNHGMAGAPQMAGLAALRAGAGLVSIACRAALSVPQPELMAHTIETADQLGPLLEACSVVVIGPGLGQDAWALSLMKVVLECHKPMLVDADGLNLLAHEPGYRPDWILTPHPGEAARLLNETVAEVQADRFLTAGRLVKRFGGTVVLKGPGTIIAGKGLSLCRQGNPGMATAGMGDVLSGIIGALLGQGLGTEQAAQLGVWVHSRAADIEAEQAGERGMLATDLLPHVRQLLNE